MEDLSLGIPGAGRVASGTHVGALYSGPAERDRLLVPFLDEGVRRGDTVLCLADAPDHVLPLGRAAGPPGPASDRPSRLQVVQASDAFFQAGDFSVDLVIELLGARVDAAVAADVDVLRVAADMSWVLPLPPGRDNLIRYESACNAVAVPERTLVMCLYDLTRIGAVALVDVLRAHPQVLLDGVLTDNPYFTDPTAPSTSVADGSARYSRAETDADDHGRVDDSWGSLTRAELRVAAHVSRGTTNRMIAAELQISHHTVDAHLKHIYVKLRIHSRVELTVLAIEHRLTIT